MPRLRRIIIAEATAAAIAAPAAAFGAGGATDLPSWMQRMIALRLMTPESAEEEFR